MFRWAYGLVMDAGIYEGLANNEYHAQTDWVSSTQIKRHLPEWYKPSENTAAKDFGSHLHGLVLGSPEPFIVVEAASWTGKAAKDAQEAAWADGKLALLEKEVPVIAAMAVAVENHDEACRLLHDLPGRNELSIFALDHRGIPMKARLDRLADDDGLQTGIDLKSFSGKPGSYSIAKAVIDWGYDVQQDHYWDVAGAGGIILDRFKFVFVAKEPPHYVTVAELDQGFQVRGQRLREIGIDRMLNPEMVPAYEGATGDVLVEMPRWARV